MNEEPEILVVNPLQPIDATNNENKLVDDNNVEVINLVADDNLPSAIPAECIIIEEEFTGIQAVKKSISSKYKLELETDKFTLHQAINLPLQSSDSKKYFAVSILGDNNETIISLQNGDIFKEFIFMYCFIPVTSKELQLFFLSREWFNSSTTLSSTNCSNEGKFYKNFYFYFTMRLDDVNIISIVIYRINS